MYNLCTVYIFKWPSLVEFLRWRQKNLQIFLVYVGGRRMSGASGCAVDNAFYCPRDETVSGNQKVWAAP